MNSRASSTVSSQPPTWPQVPACWPTTANAAFQAPQAPPTQPPHASTSNTVTGTSA